MKTLSQRRLFTILMTLFATTFCMAITLQVLGGEADLLADVLKIAVLIAVSTSFISFIFWTVTHLKKDSIPRGAIAGFCTAVTIIPLPAFLANLKTGTFSAYQNTTDNFFTALFSAIPTSIDAGLYAFVDITKASLIAVIASMIVGVFVARYVAPRAVKDFT